MVALVIVVLSIVGSLAINNNMFDVWLMLGFGALGYVFDRAKIPTAPLVIGLILGSLLDTSLAQSLLIGYGSWTVFLKSPVAAVLLLIALLSVLQATPFFRMFLRKRPAAHPGTRPL